MTSFLFSFLVNSQREWATMDGWSVSVLLRLCKLSLRAWAGSAIMSLPNPSFHGYLSGRVSSNGCVKYSFYHLLVQLSLYVYRAGNYDLPYHSPPGYLPNRSITWGVEGAAFFGWTSYPRDVFKPTIIACLFLSFLVTSQSKGLTMVGWSPLILQTGLATPVFVQGQQS